MIICLSSLKPILKTGISDITSYLFYKFIPILYIRHKFKKSFFFCKIIYKNKIPSVNAKGLEMSWLPLLERFGTFCWGEIIEELRNTYKLKDLINVPISAINDV